MVDEENPLAAAEAEAGEPSVSPATDDALAGTRARFGTTILTIARLLGRQIAREEFHKRKAEATNDNPPDSSEP